MMDTKVDQLESLIDELSVDELRQSLEAKEIRLQEIQAETHRLEPLIEMLRLSVEYKLNKQKDTAKIQPNLFSSTNGGKTGGKGKIKPTISKAAEIILERGNKTIQNSDLSKIMRNEYGIPKGKNPTNTLYGVLEKRKQFYRDTGGMWGLIKWK